MVYFKTMIKDLSILLTLIFLFCSVCPGLEHLGAGVKEFVAEITQVSSDAQEDEPAAAAALEVTASPAPTDAPPEVTASPVPTAAPPTETVRPTTGDENETSMMSDF